MIKTTETVSFLIISVQRGDELVAIDGQAVNQMTKEQFSLLLKEKLSMQVVVENSVETSSATTPTLQRGIAELIGLVIPYKTNIFSFHRSERQSEIRRVLANIYPMSIAAKY